MAEAFVGVSWFAYTGVAAVFAAVFTVIQIPKQTPINDRETVPDG